jgi:hypothetical protein
MSTSDKFRSLKDSMKKALSLSEHNSFKLMTRGFSKNTHQERIPDAVLKL